jgi:glycosyltransferase involved in cell wall biosynthesis
MRIAIISDLKDWSWAGCEELWAAAAESALRAGHQVAFFPYRETIHPNKIRPLEERGLTVRLPGGGARAAGVVRKRVSFKLGNKLAQSFPWFAGIHEFAPDMIFISGGDALPNPQFLRDLERSGVLRLPYAVVCHNSYLFESPVSRSYQQAAASYYQGARLTLFTAHRTHEETEHLLAAKLNRFRIVRNPVNMTDLNPMPMPPGSTVRIANVGRLAVTSKGQDILIAALGSRRFRERDWELSIYGDGPDLQHLKVWADYYRVADRVVFKGYGNNVRQIWTENHLLAMASRVESSPLAIVEAMFCCRPTVVNDVGGVREFVTEPETGFISEGIDIESFEDALERAWAARAEWETIGARARERVLEMYDPDPGGTVLKLLAEARNGK